MKSINNYILVALARPFSGILTSVLLLASCQLHHPPLDLIPYDTALKSMDDATKWDNGIYSTLRGKMGGAYILAQEAQADMLNAHVANTSYLTSFHGWNIKPEDPTIEALYHSYYAALTDVNILLEKIDDIPLPEGAEEKALQMKDIYKGNALFARAFYHFNLAIRWGKPYKATTANEDLCVQLRLHFKPLDKPALATNAEVWGSIMSDLDRAIALLKDVPKSAGSSEISADVALALKARVALYMGDMASALEYSEAIIASGVYKLIPPLGEGEKDSKEHNPFIDMWNGDSGEEQIFQPFIDKPNEIPTNTNLYGADLNTYLYYQREKKQTLPFNKPSYIPCQWVTTLLFESGDDRRIPAYFETSYTTVRDHDDVRGPIVVVSKFKGNPKFRDMDSEVWGGYVPNSIQAPKPFRVAEQYLIASEAAFALKQEDKATKYLNELKLSRGLAPVNLTGVALEKEIRDERTRELAYEGFRLWDLRRWEVETTPRSKQVDRNRYSDFVSGQFEVMKSYKPDEELYVWPLPLLEKKVNDAVK